MKDYYRVYAGIDLDAIRGNIKTMKSLVPEDKKMLAVIKANGYGHGAVELAKELVDLCDYYALAIVEEAIELREHGIKKPLLLLGYTSPREFQHIIDYDITPSIFSYEDAKKLDEVAKSKNKIGKIHIKLDTGMSRIGYLCDSANVDNTIEEIVKISSLEHIYIEGIFTHYAKADEIVKDAAMKQLATFTKVFKLLEKENVDIPIKHISNSAGIMEMPNDSFDMVRSGISTYGLYPSEEVDHDKVMLTPAMSLIASVVHVKKIKKGTAIGYGGTYIAEEDMKVATIPVGYADGYPRALSNIGRVLIHGQYASIIGRVCMDQFMVDISHIPNVVVGDKVTLVGTQDDKTITVEELAAPAASFNYEFVCNISRRVPRVYFKDGICVHEIDYI